ncbi:hypothetical protein ABFX02_09G024400 [Erythranthe guttata]
MIQRFDRTDRRILDFPAVHPCEGISPATLLESLINLSNTIISNYQSKSFPTQRKNARETIRQISILSIFFEEIKERVPEISDSIALCLSELHITFQKIRFLLEDCSRDGAKALILMKSNSVSTHFQTLTRVIATTLDILLPLNSIGISPEITELVQMLSTQARRRPGLMGTDPRDEAALRGVILVLNQFENRFEPDPFTARRILAHLGIRTWSECRKETRFLDERIRAEPDEREVPLLSGLLGFLSYCRGVLFDDCDFNDHDSDGRSSSGFEAISFLSFEDFRCPISLELMTDPVTVSTGQTYDRVSIQKWLKQGSLLCPKTGEKLETADLIPNTNLRKLIQRFCTEYDVSLAKSRKKNRDISSTILPGSPANAEAIKFLSEYLVLSLGYGTDHQKNKAAYEIRLLAKSNIFNRARLIESGSVPPLLEMCSNPMLQENAVSALLKLSKQPTGQTSILENGGLNPIIEVLKNGVSQESRQTAAAVIFYLSSVHKYRRIIGEHDGIFPSLLEVAKNGTACGKKNSVVAIFALLFHHKNRTRAIEAGAVATLLNLLEASPDKAELQTDALAVLSALADSVDGSVEIVRASSSDLSLILRCLQNVETRAGKEYSVSILHSLCLNCGDDVLDVLSKEASLMSVLYSLLTEGTSHAGRKARSLIKILQKFCETRLSSMIGEVGREQRFVNVR